LWALADSLGHLLYGWHLIPRAWMGRICDGYDLYLLDVGEPADLIVPDGYGCEHLQVSARRLPVVRPAGAAAR
jgi:hypothetical protein